MKITRSSASLLLLALTSACTADAEPEAYLDLDDTRASGDPRDEVCDPSHQIAYDTGVGPFGCDSFGPWVGERLFQGPGVPAGLTRYCRYTADGATNANVTWLKNKLDTTFGAGVELGTDCRVVTPEGSATKTALADGLSEYFDWYSGRVSPDEIEAAYSNANPSRVDVAVVDTAPKTISVPPLSDHGPIVASLINSFVCPTGSPTCAVRVETFLGLPRTVGDPTPNTTKGGTLGLQSDLARGVFAALRDFGSSDAEHLVVNLSVAWEPEVFGGAEAVGDLSPPVRAVYDALRAARCRGALIVAAAGNSQGLTCDEAAMAPALWEERPAPTPAECSAELGISGWAGEATNYAPLVHAVGGLTNDALMVSNGREFGMPRLGAASSHVFVEQGLGMEEDEVRTGTSLGTAVTAAAASLVWSYHPTKSPSQVMNTLYGSGNPTSLTADFGLNGEGAAVRRVNVCRAITNSCSNGGCGGVNWALPCDEAQPVGVRDFATELALAPHTNDQYATDFEAPLECENACKESYDFYPAPNDPRKCAQVKRDPWDKLTAPQPIFGGCGECLVAVATDGTSTVQLNIDDDYDGIDILAVDIEVFDHNGKSKTISLSETSLQSGAFMKPRLDPVLLRQYDITLPMFGFVPTSASVLITFDGVESTLDPLIVAQ